MWTIKLFCFATHKKIHKLFFSNLPQIRITTQKRPKSVLDTDNPYQVACLVMQLIFLQSYWECSFSVVTAKEEIVKCLTHFYDVNNNFITVLSDGAFLLNVKLTCCSSDYLERKKNESMNE